MNYKAALKKIAPARTVETIFDEIENNPLVTATERTKTSLSFNFKVQYVFTIKFDENKLLFDIYHEVFSRREIGIDKMVDIEKLLLPLIDSNNRY